MDRTVPLFRVRAARGFTLIELLVVVAIIAILISVLLPALGNARRAAKGTKCACNLRSVGQAFAVYLADNAAVYPPSYIYPSDWDGNYDLNNQPAGHPFGYIHWSWFLFNRGSVKDDAFQCPEMPHGGLPRTNPGPDQSDWEGGQEDQNGQTVANPFGDKQVRRIAFTTNAAIVPRNKFTYALSGGNRRNICVSETNIREPRGVILATEFNKNWRVSTDPHNANLVKSHRPVSAFWSASSGPDEYSAPPSGMFEYGQPGAALYGLRSADEIDRLTGVIETGADGPEVNAVGRHHPGGDKLGGATNFLYIDSHVEKKPILQTMIKREWGSAYYSLDGPNTEVRYPQQP